MSSSSSQHGPALMSWDNYVESIRIDYKEVASATNNFADENLISESTSFKVYKGQLSHLGELINIVARKCLQDTVGINEVTMSKDIRHKNIVSIFKIVAEDDKGFIINKHESNGSLEKHLSGSTLTWIQRLHICVRVADALSYIHNLQDDKSVIHGNIKSSHILLDHNWEPKLNGFGFATLVKKHYLHLTSKYNGSLEYMDPEYERTRGLTHKSDVFSFGVVLFEVLFGRKADGENWYFARLARSHYEARTLDGMIDSDLRKQIDEHSLKVFSETAYSCLKEGRALRPDMDQIFKKLREAFELQQSHECYVKSSNHLKYFSLGINGAKNYVISATKFSYKYRWAQIWHRIPQSRFKKVAKMSISSNLNIHIKIRGPRLSSDVNYAVHLIFKFCGPRKSSSKSAYVNFTYKMGRETFHAYFATWRDKDWMKIELCHFLNHKEYTNFEVLIQGLSRSYCANDAIYVEGIEFEAIDNLKQEDIEKTMAIQQELPTYSEKRSGNDYEGGELFSLNKINVKKHLMLSAMEVLYDCSNVEPFHSESSAKSRNAHCRLHLQRSHLHLRRSHLHLRRSHLHLRRTTCTSGDLAAPPETGIRFQKVIELLPQQVFGIKSKIRSQMLSPDTDYTCYLVFKLSEKCHGLHSPVRVRNVLQWKDKEIGLVCFRPTNQWNSHDTFWVPKRREDGWMEVRVWNFNSTSVLRNGRIPMHLKLITYDGTMSGLIVRGHEIRPMKEYV